MGDSNLQILECFFYLKISIIATGESQSQSTMFCDVDNMLRCNQSYRYVKPYMFTIIVEQALYATQG